VCFELQHLRQQLLQLRQQLWLDVWFVRQLWKLHGQLCSAGDLLRRFVRELRQQLWLDVWFVRQLRKLHRQLCSAGDLLRAGLLDLQQWLWFGDRALRELELRFFLVLWRRLRPGFVCPGFGSRRGRRPGSADGCPGSGPREEGLTRCSVSFETT
jgi:hypothetical protein